MDTNCNMLRDLDRQFTPKKRHIVEMNEIYFINKALCLDEMDVLQLRNLRDFAVLYFEVTDPPNDEHPEVTMDDWLKRWDKKSAILSVIDRKIFNLGQEV